jgi:hypothetical protein
MSTSSEPRNRVEVLAEEFLDRQRRGEKPTLREYLNRHPDLGDEICLTLDVTSRESAKSLVTSRLFSSQR